MEYVYCSNCLKPVKPSSRKTCTICGEPLDWNVESTRSRCADLCPTKESLSDYLSDELSSEESDSIEIHIEECNDCEQRLAVLSGFENDNDTVNVRTEEEESIPNRIGKYKLTQLIGEGTFGRVYRAEDPNLHRAVAIKVLKKSANPGTKRKYTFAELENRALAFRQEARTLAEFDHANIVPVYDFDVENGEWYIVSKFIDGCSLRQHIRTQRYTAEDAARLIATLADALHHAHSRRLIHRDIKPDNILLDKSGCPFLADFGLTLSDADYGSHTVSQGGTPAYMSPEQARSEGHLVDSRSDIFSLGVVFYELLTGERPFQGSRSSEVLERIRTLEPRPPRMLNDTIPKELERICLKALKKRVEDRFTTGNDMAESLRAAIEQPETSVPIGQSLAATETAPKRSEKLDMRADFAFGKLGCAFTLTFALVLFCLTPLAFFYFGQSDSDSVGTGQQAERALLNSARELHDSKRLEEAKATLITLIEDYPKSLLLDEAYFRLAEIRFATGEYEAAAIDYSAVVEQWPNSELVPDSLYGRGRAYVRIDDLKAAVSDFSRILADFPQHELSAQTTFARAMAHQQAGEYAKALTDVKSYLATNLETKASADAFYVEGLCYLGLEEYAMAATTFRKLLEKNPRYADADKVRISLDLASKNAVDAQATEELATSDRHQVTPIQPNIRIPRMNIDWGGPLAFAQYRNGDYEAALESLRLYFQQENSLNDSNDDKAETYFWIGMCQFNLDKFAAAVTSFNASLAANPNWRHADVALLIVSRAERRLGRVADAKSTLIKLIKDYPKSSVLDQAHFRLAESYYKSAEYDEATQNYSKVIDNWPESEVVPFSLYGRGWTQFRSKQFTVAVNDLGRLLTDFPQHKLSTRAYYARALAHQQNGEYRAALEDIQSYLVTKPNANAAADALYVRGLCYAGMKDHDTAAKTFREILEKNPKYSSADKVLYELAWSLKKNGDDQAAVATFERLATTDPDSPYSAEAYYHVGEARYRGKSYQSAADAYKKARQSGSTPDLREKAAYKLAWAQFQLGRNDVALDSFRQQLKIRPEGSLAADALYMSAECLFKLSRFQESLEVYRKALDSLPKGSRMRELAYLHAGQSAAQLKQWDTALSFYSTLTEKFPNSNYLSQSLFEEGYARQHLGQSDQALDLYAQVATKSSGELGARARFMMGEIHFQRSEYIDAIREFGLVMSKSGDDSASDPIKRWQVKSAFEAGRIAALLAKQEVDRELRDQHIDTARKFFRYVKEQDPESAEAIAAMEVLKRLGV